MTQRFSPNLFIFQEFSSSPTIRAYVGPCPLLNVQQQDKTGPDTLPHERIVSRMLNQRTEQI
jgi:hypothetical protein